MRKAINKRLIKTLSMPHKCLVSTNIPTEVEEVVTEPKIEEKQALSTVKEEPKKTSKKTTPEVETTKEIIKEK